MPSAIKVLLFSMVRGEGVVVFSPVIAVREKSGLCQSQFAELLGAAGLGIGP